MFVVRASTVRPAGVKPAPARKAIVMRSANPATQANLDAEMAKAMKEAENCETAGECAAAWDAVEEISAEMSHQKAKADTNQDPLEAFCSGNPDADECRLYED